MYFSFGDNGECGIIGFWDWFFNLVSKDYVDKFDKVIVGNVFIVYRLLFLL